MSLINSSWLTADQIAKNIIDKGEDITLILNEVDAQIVAAVLEEQLTEDDIAIDVDGYVTSVFLKQYGIYLGLSILFERYRGSGSGNPDDIYGRKADSASASAIDWRSKITSGTITGADGSEVVEPSDMVSQSFVRF